MQTKVLRQARPPEAHEVTKFRVNYYSALSLLREGFTQDPSRYVLLITTTSEWAKQNMAAQIRKLDPWTDFTFIRTTASDPGDWEKVYRVWGRIEQ